jgi:acyl-coenzyme A synthetase/AMP-(fatty) acid ligase
MDDWIFKKIKESGEQMAVVFDNKTFSYNDLSQQIEQFYDQIIRKIKKNSIVAIVSDYNFEVIAMFFALYRNRNIIIPVTTKIESEIAERQQVANCEYAVRFDFGKPVINKLSVNEENNPLVARLQNDDKAGLILFSSGSTGVPKAMVHDLDNLIDSYQDKRGKRLVFMIFLMFDHIGGLNTMLNCIAMGVTMVFPANRNPDNVCALIEKYQVNVLPASPTFLNLILISASHLKYDLSSLRMITYGTEPMPDSLLLKLKENFQRVKFLQTFGTSETGITATSSKSSDSTFLKIDDPNTEYKIVDGELYIRSKTQILGYINSSMERFTDDGWFRTGDLVEQTEDGFIKIIGRNSEIINVGGEKVLPAEIESLLFQMQEVKDCAVFGENNPITGQIVVAKVMFNREMKPSEAKRLVIAFCAGKLEKYKIPAKVLIMPESEFTERYKKIRR